MNMQKSPKAMLVALTDGSAPHTDPLDCDDMRGPRSFFGESAIMPRPIADLPGCCEDLTDAALVAAYGGACSLWHCHDGLSDAERARRIRSARLQCSLPLHETDEPRARKLDVPARTYLAGRSSSSFAVAWKLYQDGLLPEWGAVLCSCQTEGRGRLRRHWHSPRGNLHVTFRLPADPLFQGDAASLLIGMLLLRAFRALGFPLSLKWPNDLLLEERLKVGGILLEERGGVVLAGLGVNLVEAPEALRLREGSALLAGLLLPQ
ncbi:hypothetical protein LJC09_04880, partial [Desulfovibrio sp. OttesenSCG-928-F20]|nr:hypothetical protein [Desulfovibrio sp. OttesenSCG-928-F20]